MLRRHIRSGTLLLAAGLTIALNACATVGPTASSAPITGPRNYTVTPPTSFSAVDDAPSGVDLLLRYRADSPFAGEVVVLSEDRHVMNPVLEREVHTRFKQKGSTLTSARHMNIGGVAARRLAFTAQSSSGRPVQRIALVFSTHDVAYRIIGTAPADARTFAEAFDALAHSLRFNKKPHRYWDQAYSPTSVRNENIGYNVHLDAPGWRVLPRRELGPKVVYAVEGAAGLRAEVLYFEGTPLANAQSQYVAFAKSTYGWSTFEAKPTPDREGRPTLQATSSGNANGKERVHFFWLEFLPANHGVIAAECHAPDNGSRIQERCRTFFDALSGAANPPAGVQL